MLRDDLIAARALIDTPDKWTQHTYARNPHGEITFPEEGDAICFCGQGAVFRVLGNSNSDRLDAALEALNQAAGCYFVKLNDDPATTHADVLAVFDRAIAAANA